MSDASDFIRSTTAFIHLRTLGRAKGSLTYEDVEANLPKAVTSSVEIDAWLTALSGEGIEIVEGPPNVTQPDFVLLRLPILLAVVVGSCGTGRQPMAASPGANPQARTTEISSWKLKCESGDQTACNNLGFLIERAEPQRAERLYEGACEHDIPDACHNLGFVLYHRGEGERAISAFAKACGLSQAAACDTIRSMMNARERRTGNLSCFEIQQTDGSVSHICSNLSGDWDDSIKDTREPP